MNSRISWPRFKEKPWISLPLDHLFDVAPKMLKALWVFGCLMLAAAVLFNLSQVSNLRTEIDSRRMMESHTQDLLIHSLPLRHLTDSREIRSRSRLQLYGFSSPQEVLNQLDSELLLARETNPEHQIQDWLDSLAIRFQELKHFSHLKSPTDVEQFSALLDEWLITLSALSEYMRHLSSRQDRQVAKLQRDNLYLASAVLLYSLFLVGFQNWSRKRQSQRYSTEMATLHDEIQRDPLTGLLNRRGWAHHTQKTIKQLAKFGRTPLSIAILDIDFFKQYNDAFGHDAGDQRLVEFGNLLKSQFRPCDRVARIGGEEFAILLPNCTVDDAKRIIDRIRQSDMCQINFSAGISDLGECRTMERALVSADQALYLAKSTGRNRACIAQPTASS